MTTPAVSVLVPCFNHGQWIDEAIASVLDQTVQDFEIIVVDDGSTDVATAEKLANYDRPRTRVVRTENRGLPAARNLAASLANGRFYCALDADDRLAPTWFEKALAEFERDPDLAFVSHWVQAFGDEEYVWRQDRCDLLSLLQRNVVNGAAMVTRCVFDAVGGYDESMRYGCEDWDFWLRVVKAGYQGRIVPEVLYFYRRSPQSMSRQMLEGDAYRAPMQQMFDRHSDTFRAHAIDLFVAKELEMVSLALEIHKLERDHITYTKPRLHWLREESAAVERTIAVAVREREQYVVNSTLVHELRAEADAAAQRSVHLERELLAARARERALQDEAAGLQAQQIRFRKSWSWKLTAPLRFVGGFFVR